MKTAVVAMLAIAGSASADLTGLDRSNYTIFQDGVNASITATPLGTGFANRGSADQYSDLDPGPTGYQAFPAATGIAGADDYTSIASDDIELAEFGFVGGVNQANGIMFVDFFDAGGVFVDGFGVALTNPGNFIYTITITAAVIAPNAGFVQIDVPGTSLTPLGPSNTGVQGQWFLGDAGATIGNAGAPVALALNHNFRINGTVIPAPASVALLGLGGLAAIRRRR